MLNHIKKLFGITPKEAPVAEVPYKVETPVVDTADIALAQLPPGGAAIADRATQAVVESMAPAKKPAAKKTTAKKAPPAKKPRTPKAAK
jgi:hypothetical protein